jgi:hypothetical protein
VAQPPSVSASADAIIDLYRQAEQRLLARLRQIVGDRARQVEAGRVAAMIRATVAEIDQLDHRVAVELDRQLRGVYEQGGRQMAASIGGQWVQVSSGAVEQLAATAVTNVAGTLRDVEAATKQALRRLTRLKAGDVIVGGQPLQRASELFSREATQQLGILTVRYSNGAVHSLADWADTAVRTETATAFNRGAFGQARQHRVRFMECVDSPLCGLDGHDDPYKPYGDVLPIEQAERYPISHPRCVRSWSGSPTVTSLREAEQSGRFTDEEKAQLQEQERKLRAEQPTRTGRDLSVAAQARLHQQRQPRRPRSEGPGRQPRTPRTPRLS